MTETSEFMGGYHLERAQKAVAETEAAYKALWDAVKPKTGEVWTKDPCQKGLCSTGWSFGAGTRRILDTAMDYGSPHHLVCGCLYQVQRVGG